MKVKLKSVFINTKKADGTPYRDKNGNPFKMCVIEGESGKKASMFIGKFQEKFLPTLESWKAGDEVDVIFEQSGDFLNFKLPNKTDELSERLTSLELRVSRLEGQSGLVAQPAPEHASKAPFQDVRSMSDEALYDVVSKGMSDHIDVNEIPF